MKALAIASITAIALILVGRGLGDAAEKPPRKFGPEWTPNKEGDTYYKKIEIPVGRHANNLPEWNWYTVAMDNNTVQITESDDNLGVSMSASPKGDLSKAFVDADIVLDEKGKVRETTIKLSKNIYFDLDGDGVIDAFYDKRDKDGTPIVIFKGRLVPVEDFKSGFRTARNAKPTMWGIGRKEQYVFDKGVWNLK